MSNAQTVTHRYPMHVSVWNHYWTDPQRKWIVDLIGKECSGWVEYTYLRPGRVVRSSENYANYEAVVRFTVGFEPEGKPASSITWEVPNANWNRRGSLGTISMRNDEARMQTPTEGTYTDFWAVSAPRGATMSSTGPVKLTTNSGANLSFTLTIPVGGHKPVLIDNLDQLPGAAPDISDPTDNRFHINLRRTQDARVSVSVSGSLETDKGTSDTEDDTSGVDVKITEITQFQGVRRTQSGVVDMDNERATVRNVGRHSADISGWTLNCGGKGQDFTFPEGTVLAPDDAVYLWTAPQDGLIEGIDFTLGWQKRRAWRNAGDTGTLTDAEGKVVDTLSYGDKAG